MCIHYNSKKPKNEMFLPLIKSKFIAPKLTAGYVRRESLLKELEEGLTEQKKLTLVVGSAGYGKSSLVIDYINYNKTPFLWYSLNEADTDLIIFINHLIKGLKRTIPNLDEAPLELLLSSQNPADSIHNTVGMLVEDLSLKVQEKFVIVLDDYHFLRNSEIINKAIEYLIEYLPENFQLILISRYTPNIKTMSLLRVRQQLKEISLSELKFTREEVRKIVSTVFTEEPEEAELENLYLQTGGWIGIIILLTQVYRTNKSVRDFLLTSTDKNQPIFDYLANEIYEIQEEKIKKFMLVTSLLPEINNEICQEAGIEKAIETLNYIKTLSLFEEYEEEYRYNPVLKEFLEEKARETMKSEEINEIYYRIANYYLKNNIKEVALEYFLLSLKYREAEVLITDISQELINANRLETLNKYLLRFPDEYLAGSADLQILLGEVNRLWGNYSEAMNHYCHAEEMAIKEHNYSTLGKVYVYESIIHTSKGEANSRDLLNEALKIFPENDNPGLALAYNTKGIFYLFNEKISESLGYFEKSLKYYEAGGDHFGQAKVLHNMGYAYSMLGSFDHSLDTYQRSVKQVETTGKLPHPMTYNNIAILYNYSGKFTEARSFAEKALDIAQKLQYKRETSYAFWTLGMISANLESFLKSEDYFNTCLSIGLEMGDRQIQAYALSGLSELARLQHKYSKALELIEEAIRRRDLPLDAQGVIELLIQKVSICIDTSDFQTARAIIADNLLKNVEKLGYKYYLTHLYFYLSLISEREGKEGEHIDQASRLIKENGYYFFLSQQKYIPESLKNKLEEKDIEVKITIPSKLKFYCFGEFRAFREEKPISSKEWSGFKTKLAVAYLLHNPKGVTKEQLANLLYPDTEITRTAINVILSRIRKALEPELDKKDSSKYIVFNEGKYYFNSGSSYWLDTEQFTYLIKEAGESDSEEKKITIFNKVIDLYEGNFLSEFSGELWCQMESESYKRKMENVFSEVSDFYFKKGEYQEIISLTAKELAIDICNENAFQRKIKAMIAMDKKDEAMKHYKIMKNILKSELGVEPSHESYMLYQKLV